MEILFDFISLKTTYMEANSILSANILDIVFEGKNKAYGAYNLRKTYNRRLGLAMFITVMLILSVILFTLIASSMKPVEKRIFVERDWELEPPKNESKPEKIKPEIKPQMNTATVRSVKTIIVKDDQVDPADKPPTVDDIDKAVIADHSSDGGLDSGLKVTPIKITGTTVLAQTNTNDGNEIVDIVEIEAQFPGGLAAWKRYLQDHLNPGNAIENGAPAGTYTVMVKFVVSKDGSISDIQCLTDPGYGMGEDARKIISRGPAWKPAIQNGRPVNARHLQPITFVIDES